MRKRTHGDAGQVFPIYITVVAGLLFLAFAYFAVGQAAVNRNGAQTAADAAALAAAQETRDRLADRWTLDVLDPTQWQDIFDGVGATTECGEAARLAALNDAGDVRCDRIGLRYDVTVQANKSAGKSVIPATSVTQAHASATAVIESLCTFEPAPEESGDPGNTGEPEDPGDPEDPDDPQDVVLPRLTCKDGRIWDLDPADLTDLPGPEDLFDVHLATG
ncbi:pilus assembly protein TadG-related protein [Streptomyces sp. NBC_01275]|uniref:pilus assembly protein TadG-related protein n=1 Tax=Streptomyces sp. NBC_01275 TaxID=2903807 RepID=UPI0022563443|nr:pilus assembly protein TadG-related protein [Streptomyces sp. NBC_01275]MCX4764688.1 pilus assembly protein TadG-related protein [Streptomyces sp. NBC_01275]